jgi:hypothetical protein
MKRAFVTDKQLFYEIEKLIGQIKKVEKLAQSRELFIRHPEYTVTFSPFLIKFYAWRIKSNNFHVFATKDGVHYTVLPKTLNLGKQQKRIMDYLLNSDYGVTNTYKLEKDLGLRDMRPVFRLVERGIVKLNPAKMTEDEKYRLNLYKASHPRAKTFFILSGEFFVRP